MGYHRAGFDVVGVDIEPQPHYPFEFHQLDALEFLSINDAYQMSRNFDAIHASPPCQAYSAARHMWKGRLADDRHSDLYAPTKALLAKAGLPWVIENVEGSPLTDYIILCGDMVGLPLRRHRLFETSWFIWNPPVCRNDHPGATMSVFGGGAITTRRDPRNRVRRSGNLKDTRVCVPQREVREAMGIDWMNRDELSQAIPPAYTEFIGHQLLRHLAKSEVKS
jgi:DNA (cytosine-5)-methyltransferase 1